MGDYISELPGHLLSDIFSSLTVRDAFRIRSLSPRWKDIPDTRCVLLFDVHTILGSGSLACKSKSMFVKAVDQFLKIWIALKKTTLKIQFGLGNEHASHIDGWTASVSHKGVEELDLNFKRYGESTLENYVFPCHLFDTAKGSCLKHLRLQFCNLISVRDASTKWLRNLYKIELAHVSLCSTAIECIMSSAFNLESLILRDCDHPEDLCVQHPSLKKLVVVGQLKQVELSCPHLETLHYSGCSDFTFLNVPLLKEVSLNFHFKPEGSSSVFCNLAIDVPQLQTLSLSVTTKIPPLPTNMSMSRLKRLDLFTRVSFGFDLFCITHMLYASPVLEALCLKVEPNSLDGPRHKVQHPQYLDCQHFHLKEVQIEGLYPHFRMVELIEYLLRNGDSLQQMIFIVGVEGVSSVRGEPKFTKWQNINPNVELVVI